MDAIFPDILPNLRLMYYTLALVSSSILNFETQEIILEKMNWRKLAQKTHYISFSEKKNHEEFLSFTWRLKPISLLTDLDINIEGVWHISVNIK